jgi:hypothetical protein
MNEAEDVKKEIKESLKIVGFKLGAAKFWFRVNSQRTVKHLTAFHFLFFKVVGLILIVQIGRAA